MSSTLRVRIPMDEFLAIVSDAAEELFTAQLGCRDFSVVARGSGVPVTHVGAYVALVGEEQSSHVGLVASIDTCRMLARLMLAMDESEELDDGDLCDAMGEIANLLGGATRRRLNDRAPGLRLALPLFVQGRLIASERQEVGTLTVRFGASVASLLVLRTKRR